MSAFVEQAKRLLEELKRIGPENRPEYKKEMDNLAIPSFYFKPETA